ncbi:MerR family transcriptional regulator [Providencia sneebia]|uniref:MerR family transcriptional regulator n=1 Tax=Providencia sneebia DSM 19967 TaxID=1141660 RepID=K8WN39_9GAMM|nr:MerR family transcriptional regulator [Providencia sneebia]EKT57600.1 MerR family transcriptional regulator [Providencia sneebia DSM 19967]
MNIGEIARHTGISPSRIRFYERIGLLRTVKRKANGYRTYSDNDIAILKLIIAGQSAGFSLEDLNKLLPKEADQWEQGVLLDALYSKVKSIEALQEKLTESKKQLLSLIEQIETKPQDISCSENARRLLLKL